MKLAEMMLKQVCVQHSHLFRTVIDLFGGF